MWDIFGSVGFAVVTLTINTFSFGANLTPKCDLCSGHMWFNAVEDRISLTYGVEIDDVPMWVVLRHAEQCWAFTCGLLLEELDPMLLVVSWTPEGCCPVDGPKKFSTACRVSLGGDSMMGGVCALTMLRISAPQQSA
jgi:hypothetical protein